MREATNGKGDEIAKIPAFAEGQIGLDVTDENLAQLRFLVKCGTAKAKLEEYAEKRKKGRKDLFCFLLRGRNVMSSTDRAARPVTFSPFHGATFSGFHFRHFESSPALCSCQGSRENHEVYSQVKINTSFKGLRAAYKN